ncbi:hypothetical protein NDU88_000123 [Pleurodeles waltl]|uniref:RRM domain-containing protein n=1 Tax=Pleurodeles waltl TaxID=8319 RepID=A0AAV7KPV9_PLEWA|nr:hypothetical protein NDU88_000123 [Pleurodeles waltl]
MNQWDAQRRAPWPAQPRDLNGDQGFGAVGLLEAERGRRFGPAGYPADEPFSRRGGPQFEGGGQFSMQRGPGFGDRSFPSGMAREQPFFPGLSRDRSPLRGLSREQQAYPGLPQQRASYPEESRGLIAYPPLSQERTPYPALSRQPVSYPEPSREPVSYPEPSREPVSYPNFYGEHAAYPTQARNMPPYGGPTMSLSPSARDSQGPLAYPDQPYALPTGDYGRSRSPVTNKVSAPQRGSVSDGPLPQYLSKSPSPVRRADHCSDRAPNRTSSFTEVGFLMRKVSFVKDSSRKSGHPKEPRAAFGSVVRVEGFHSDDRLRDIKEFLAQSMELYGTVTGVEVCDDATTPYALVFFSEVEASDLVLRKAKRDPLFSKALTISPWVMLVPDKDRPVRLAQTRVMYVENLNPLITVEELHKVCERFGEVLDVELKDTAYGDYRNAIVQYWDLQNAKTAAWELNSTRVRKYVIKTTCGRNTVSKCVWVDGLPKDIEERELLKPFEECGTVEKHLFDRKRGAALILYGAILPARQCVRSMENGKTSIGGKFIQVDYANDRAQLAFCRAMEKSGQDIGNFLFL